MRNDRHPARRIFIGGLLVAGTLATPLAGAQTTVTLYGIADGDFRVDHTSVGTLKSIGSGGESASRWGLRGTEDLGGGWKAIFNFEQDFDLSDNSVPQGDIVRSSASQPTSSTGSRLFGRRAIVGLHSTTFGEIRVGREYTPLYRAWRDADPFEAGTVARGSNYAVGSVPRFDNTVTYETPKVAGLTATLQYRPSEQTAVANDLPRQFGQGYGGSVVYESGPLYVGLGYLHELRGSLPTKSETAAIVWDFAVAKLHGFYFRTNAASLDTGPGAGSRYQSYALGTTVPLQAFTIKAAVARIDNQDHYVDRGNGDGARSANVFGAGVTYSFSKRTDLYLAASKIVNGAAAAFIISDMSNNGLYTTSNVPVGFNPWSAQLGLRHMF